MDGLHKQLKISQKYLPETIDYLSLFMYNPVVRYDDSELSNDNVAMETMDILFRNMSDILQRDGDDDIDDYDKAFWGNVNCNLLNEDEI